MQNPCSLFILAAFASALAFTPAAARSAISVKSKAASVTVEIGATLRHYPGLADNLLAEGRRWAEKMRADADKELHDNPDEFRDRQHWSLEREYAERSVVARYVSILRSDYTFTGGAHPNSKIDSILWDRDGKKRISIRPFLTESADDGPTMNAMAKLVRIAVAREKIERGTAIEGDDGKKLTAEQVAQDPSIADGVKPTLLQLGPVTLAPSTVANKSSGFTFHFSPYDVGAYAEGPYTPFVPWTELKPYLSAEGLAIFGGERPETDKKNDPG
jgi:Deacetylase PdaC